jgi:FkbM family methyltransferase
MIGRVLHASRKRVKQAKLLGSARRLPLSTRSRLMTAIAFSKLGRDELAVGSPMGEIVLGRDTFDIDLRVLAEVFRDEFYESDFRGAAVLDLGAHKGYYGAFAALGGARSIVSYEPESGNFSCLQRSVASFAATGVDWLAKRAAVGVEEGVAQLVVSRESWSHSVAQGSDAERTRARTESVPVIPIDQVLSEAGSLAGDRLIVKVNVEGSECEIVLQTRPERWSIADEVRVEVHPFAQCSSEEIVAHFARAGLTVVRRAGDGLVYLSFRRAASDRV